MKNRLTKQLIKGINIESEHSGTYDKIKKYVKQGKFPLKKEFYKMIAEEHINEDKHYYDKLKNPVDEEGNTIGLKPSNIKIDIPNSKGRIYTSYLGDLSKIEILTVKNGEPYLIVIEEEDLNNPSSKIIFSADKKTIIIYPVNIKEILK